MSTVDRVRRTALKIGRSLSQDVDLLVVELAALFHDMAGQSPIQEQSKLS